MLQMHLNVLEEHIAFAFAGRHELVVLGVNTSLFAWALNITCVVLMFAVDMAVESEGASTVRVGIPRFAELKLRQIEPYNLTS